MLKNTYMIDTWELCSLFSRTITIQLFLKYRGIWSVADGFRFVAIHSINSVKEDKEVREFKRGALFLTHTNMYSPDSSLFLTLRAAVYYSRINGYRHGLILKVYFSLSLFGSPWNIWAFAIFHISVSKLHASFASQDSLDAIFEMV